MTAVQIEALVDRREWLGMLAGAEQLSECLTAAAGGEWPVRLELRSPDGADRLQNAPDAVILSLLAEVDRAEEPIERIEARLTELVESLADRAAPIALCTVFRCVEGPDRQGRLERISRLNLMAMRLSQSTGIGIVDIDRALAHIGARPLRTDYRLGGRLAAEVVGHQIVWNLLSQGLDAAAPPDVQERAKAIHGGLREIDKLIARRLTKPLRLQPDG